MNQDISINELAELYMTTHSRPFKKSWKQDEAYIRNYINPTFGGRVAREVKRGEIELWHKRVGGCVMANRILILLSSIYNKGIEWEILETNPTKKIKKFPERPRDLFIPREDLHIFFNELEKSQPYFKWALRFILLTGARKKETRLLKWVDITEDYVHIKDRKNGEDLLIPMTQSLKFIFKNCTRKGAYVFTFTGEYQEDYRRQWDRLRRRLRAKNFLQKKRLRFNDLRRTVGSYLGQDGKNARLIADILGQKNISSTTPYTRFQLKHVTEALNELPSTKLNSIDIPLHFELE